MDTPFQNINNIGGLVTDRPADKIPTRNLSDVSCIDFSSFGLAQTVRGPRLFGNQITEVGEITRAFLYKKNFGAIKKVFLRVRDNYSNSVLEWFNSSNPDNSDGKWETLVSGLNTGAIMGFAPFNQSNNNQLIFCNAVNNYSEWNGCLTRVVSVTTNTIICEDDLTFENFKASDTIIVDGTTYTYTGKSGKTFTGVTPDPTVQNPVVGSGVAQSPDITTHSSLPKGNIFLTAVARIWLSGVLNWESAIYYSAVADALDFTTGTTPDDGGIEDFPDGGGTINLLDFKNNKIIIHKDDVISSFSLDYTSTAKIPYKDDLGIAPGIGATNQKAGAGNGIKSYFCSGTDGIKALARAIAGSDIDIGDSLFSNILPNIKNFDFSNSAVVYYQPKQVILTACKSDSSKVSNDKIIALYLKKDANGGLIADISIDYGFVNDWIVDGKDLYAFSSTDQNCYKFYERNSYNGLGMAHSLTSKEFTFDEPARLKEFNTIYVEGLISSHTKTKISIIYGIMGSQDSKGIILAWNDDYVSNKKISALGVDILGVNSLGATNNEMRDSYVFSVPIHIDAIPTNRYKIKIETYYDEDTVDESYWAISNVSFNPVLLGVENNKIINVNK